MTVDDIKQSVSMADVLERYGVKVNRNGMCCCPIHHERHPSMKVFADGYKCFACNSGGDIFKFVQEMENCSFKEAFLILGGTYEKDENKLHKKLLKAKFERNKARREKNKQFEKDFRHLLENAIFKCMDLIAKEEPFSDKWCQAQDSLPWIEYVWDLKYINGEEINKADVIRVCKRIERI